MKAITKLGLAVTMFMATAMFNNAMAQDKTYGYVYSYNVLDKVMYISHVVSGIVDSDRYYDANDSDFKTQWRNYLEANTGKACRCIVESAGFVGQENNSEYYKKRIEEIAKFKKNGFTVYEIVGFSYVNEKRK